MWVVGGENRIDLYPLIPVTVVGDGLRDDECRLVKVWLISKVGGSVRSEREREREWVDCLETWGVDQTD